MINSREISVLHCMDTYLNITENWMLNIIRAAPDIRNIITALEFNNNFPLYEDIRYWKPKKAFHRSRKIRHLIENKMFVLLRQIHILLNKGKFDLIHCHFATVGCANRKLAKLLKKPLIVSFYGYDYEAYPNRFPAYHTHYQRLFRQADLFLCEGHYGASILVKKGCPANKVMVCRLGVKAKTIPFVQRKKAAGELNLVQVARFTEKKGHVVALKSFIEALEKCPNMHLTLVGELPGEATAKDDPSQKIKAKLLELIKLHSIEDKVSFKPLVPIKELHESLTPYHIFIHHSVWTSDGESEGGAPVVLLDAQATGMPIIASKHCDIPDEVIDDKTGILCEEGNVKETSLAIERFYKMGQQEFDQFGLNGRNHVEQHYDIENNGKVLAEAYSTVIKKSRKP